MFKAGDTVIYVDESANGLVQGERYEVTGCTDGDVEQVVFLASHDKRDGGWLASCFELAPEFTAAPLDIEDLARHVHQMACEKGWWEDGKRNFGELMALATSEISEAFEEYRNGHKPHEIYYGDNGKPEGVPVELADCIIRILDTCEAEGIPLSRALREKIAYNATRPHRHGGKVC